MSRFSGNLAEDKAASFLESRGFLILERNFYAKKLGEIDIIASKDNTIHFVEVKSGITFEPIYNITKSKLRHVINSAEYYLKFKNLKNAFSIDALIVKNDDIELIENITL